MTAAFDRRLTPARPDLAAAHLAGKVEAPRFVTGRLMQVCEDVAPLCTTPSRESAIDTQAIYGETITIYDDNGEGWAWGQLTQDDYVGYIPAEALRAHVSSPTHKVRVPRTFVYPGPSIKLPPLFALPLGAAIEIVAMRGEFGELAGLGYVFAAHVASRDSAEPDFVAIAEQFLHIPYLWGGKTSLGIDCSGLVQIALAAAGINAPRDTDLQEASIGEPIAIGPDLMGLRRGDLVYWKGHVGIMRDATELLHANAHQMMVTSEPLALASARIRAKANSTITAVKRLPALSRSTVAGDQSCASISQRSSGRRRP